MISARRTIHVAGLFVVLSMFVVALAFVLPSDHEAAANTDGGSRNSSFVTKNQMIDHIGLQLDSIMDHISSARVNYVTSHVSEEIANQDESNLTNPTLTDPTVFGQLGVGAPASEGAAGNPMIYTEQDDGWVQLQTVRSGANGSSSWYHENYTTSYWGNAITSRLARGTKENPETVSAQRLLEISATGWTGDSFGLGAAIRMETDGEWTDSEQPASMDFFTSGGNIRMRIGSDGNVGINELDPDYRLHVKNDEGDVAGFTNNDGTCTINPTNTALECSSDIALKKDITEISGSSALESLMGLRGVNFRWLNQTDDEQRFGFVAQEVEEVFPDMVSEGRDGHKMLSQSALIPVMVESIKELNQRVDYLEESLDAAQIGQSVQGDELCLNDTCVTEAELRALLEIAKRQ